MKKVNATHETENHFFVHANADPSAPIYVQPDEMLYWQRFGKPRPHVSGKTMVCGHTIQRSGEPLNVGHAICIDTWAYGKGWADLPGCGNRQLLADERARPATCSQVVKEVIAGREVGWRHLVPSDCFA